MSMVASAAAQDGGVSCPRRGMRNTFCVQDFCPANACAQGKAGSDRFSENHQIGNDALVLLNRKHLSSSSEACLHLIDRQIHPVLVADLSHLFEKVVGRYNFASK